MNPAIKKAFILIVLFTLPISVYILFATAAHNFVHLPVRTKNVQGLEKFTPLNPKTKLSFEGKITVLCFFGKSIDNMQGNAFNLNAEIYQENKIYKNFQVVVLAENGLEKQAKNLLKDLQAFTGDSLARWYFGFGSLDAIKQVFDKLQTDVELNEDYASPFVFIIDKKGNLRGQKENDRPTTLTLYGYDTRSISAMRNTMLDDIKVLLAEYRLKLKKKERDIIKHQEEK